MACGTYQAFVCYAIGLFLFDCLIRLLEGEAIPQVVARGVRYVLICVISLVLYYVVLQVMLAVTGTALDDYQGVGGICLLYTSLRRRRANSKARRPMRSISFSE